MKKIRQFIQAYRTSAILFAAGFGLGYAYWYCLGCYWGSYPMSAEWWVNCIYGGIFANILADIFRHLRVGWKRQAKAQPGGDETAGSDN